MGAAEPRWTERENAEVIETREEERGEGKLAKERAKARGQEDGQVGQISALVISSMTSGPVRHVRVSSSEKCFPFVVGFMTYRHFGVYKSTLTCTVGKCIIMDKDRDPDCYAPCNSFKFA